MTAGLAMTPDGFIIAFLRLHLLLIEGYSSAIGNGSLNIVLIPSKNSSISWKLVPSSPWGDSAGETILGNLKALFLVTCCLLKAALGLTWFLDSLTLLYSWRYILILLALSSYLCYISWFSSIRLILSCLPSSSSYLSVRPRAGNKRRGSSGNTPARSEAV